MENQCFHKTVSILKLALCFPHIQAQSPTAQSTSSETLILNLLSVLKLLASISHVHIGSRWYKRSPH